MLTESYRTRGAVFAFLIGPPRDLTRQDGTAVHASVCDALGVDDIVFRYQRVEAQTRGERPFSIELDHRKGAGQLNLRITGAAQGTPTHLLLSYDWPQSNQLVHEDFDLACNAVFSALGGGWQTVLAEARIRGQVHAPGDSALSFLQHRALAPSGASDGDSRNPSFLGFRYEIPAGDFSDDDQLANPKREVTVEVLREDPRCLYLEVMSQWPQLVASSQGMAEIGPGSIRAFRSPPSNYVKDTNRYLESVVFPLLIPHRSRWSASMKSLSSQPRVSVLGSSTPVTATPSDALNQPAGEWMPGIYNQRAVTESGRSSPDGEASWADLAASARGDWFSDNPF